MFLCCCCRWRPLPSPLYAAAGPVVQQRSVRDFGASLPSLGSPDAAGDPGPSHVLPDARWPQLARWVCAPDGLKKNNKKNFCCWNSQMRKMSCYWPWIPGPNYTVQVLPQMTALTELDVSSNKTTGSVVRSLVAALPLSQMRRLPLNNCSLNDESFTALSM